MDDETQEPECRICFSGRAEEVEELFEDLCNCRGSMRYVHMSCLRGWFLSRHQSDNLDQKQRDMLALRSNLTCSVCNSTYSKRVAIKWGWKPIRRWRLYRNGLFFCLKVPVVIAIIRTLLGLATLDIFASVCSFFSRFPFIILLLCYLVIFTKFIYNEFVMANSDLTIVVT